MSGVGSSTIVGHAVVLLDLVVGRRRLGPEVGHRGGHDDDVGRGAGRQHRLVHLGRRLDLDHVDAGGAGRSTVVTRVTSAPRPAASSARA